MNIFVKWAIKILMAWLARSLSKGLVQEVQELVQVAFDTDLSGDMKKARVMEELQDVQSLLYRSAIAESSWRLNLLIELLMGKNDIEAQ